MEFYIELSECTCKSFERRVADVDFGGKWCESPLCIFHSLRKENLVKTGSKKIKRKDFDHKVEYFPFAPVFLFLRWIVRIRNKLRYESVNKNQSIIDETRNSGTLLFKNIWAQDDPTLREKNVVTTSTTTPLFTTSMATRWSIYCRTNLDVCLLKSKIIQLTSKTTLAGWSIRTDISSLSGLE